MIDLVSDDMTKFEEEFFLALQSDVQLINTMVNYLAKQRGKRVRPLLTILASRICGEPAANTYRAAALIELLHIATLVHDDVVDDAEYRRGFPSVNRVWRNKISILFGDYILSKSLINMVKIKDFDVLDLMSETAEQLSSGEILQMGKNLRNQMTESTYYDVIMKKTASLLSACCELGAITTSNNPEERKLLREFGTNFGMAFQIRDDLFDLYDKDNHTGKDSGIDVKRNMLTLPLIYAKTTLSFFENRKLNVLLKKKKKQKSDLYKIRAIIEHAGGFKYAEDRIEFYSDNAINSLQHFTDSPYKQSLIDIVQYNKTRSH